MELLLVVAVVAVLAALLGLALSRTQAQANSATCKNHLRQMGLALKMYVDDNQFRYPYAYDPGGKPDAGSFDPAEYNLFWFAKLAPYYPLQWTNVAYHCPGYKGAVIGILNDGTNQSGPRGSYAYNYRGVLGSHNSNVLSINSLRVNYGLGPIVRAVPVAAVAEPTVKVPSDMFAIGESRFLSLNGNRSFGGFWGMICGELHSNTVAFDPARHGKNYNTVFCDGHVAGMNPWLLFNPVNTAPMWNYDHQAHPELWSP